MSAYPFKQFKKNMENGYTYSNIIFQSHENTWVEFVLYFFHVLENKLSNMEYACQLNLE